MKARSNKRGRVVYVPTVILDELKDIKREDMIPKCKVDNSIAFRKMAEYTRVGREAKRVINLDFGGYRKPQPIKEYYPNEKNKTKRKRGIF